MNPKDHPLAAALPVDRVEWHEGLLLAPQHLQLLADRLDTLVAWRTLSASPFSWGVDQVEIDLALLPAGRLRIQSLLAVMPDGTVVRHAHGDGEALELTLQAHEDALQTGPLDIHLVLPMSRPILSPTGDGASRRFRSVESGPVEDLVSESPPVMVARQLPALSLAAGPVAPAGFVALRLMTLIRDHGVITRADRLPALLSIAQDSTLWREVNDLLARLRSKATLVARQVVDAEARVQDRLVQLELRERLRCLSSGLPFADAVLRTPRLHPHALYLALAQLAGPLSLLRSGAMPPIPPDYAHGDPSPVFEALLGALREAVRDVRDDVQQVPFALVDGGFELRLNADWEGRPILVALRGPSERDLVAWMAGAVIGSAADHPMLLGLRVQGAGRRQVLDGGEASPGESAAADRPLRGVGLLFSIEPSVTAPRLGDVLRIANPNPNEGASRPRDIVLLLKA